MARRRRDTELTRRGEIVVLVLVVGFVLVLQTQAGRDVFVAVASAVGQWWASFFSISGHPGMTPTPIPLAT